MKKLMFLLASGILVIASSCNKNNDNANGLLSMDVDGVKWEAKNKVGAFILNSDNRITISGNDTDRKQVSIGLRNITGVGTYDMVAYNDNAWLFIDENPSPNVTYSIWQPSVLPNKSHGILTITNILSNENGFTEVEGTFSGVAYRTDDDSVVITNGKFRDAD
jgi:hypothetical protein